MSNSMTNDYFAFMSAKGEQGQPKRRPLAVGQTVRPTQSADVIDFVFEETQIEVVESVASDTLIQRMFKRRANAS